MNPRTPPPYMHLFLLIVLLHGGCDYSVGPSTRYNVPSSKYLYFENVTTEEGVLIHGTTWPFIQIDFPTYSLDSTTGKLKGEVDFDIDGNLIAVFGGETRFLPCVGGGIASGLHGIYDLPWKNRPIWPELKTISPGASVTIRYKNSEFTLVPGETRRFVETRLDTFKTSIARITKTECITNYGFLWKSDIEKW